VRIWSGGTDIPGTFRIGAYGGSNTDVVLWEETFGNGMAGWTTFGTCGGNADSNANALFRYYPDGVIDMGAYANPGVGILGPSYCDGAVGVDSDFDDNGGVQGAFGTGRCPTGGGSQYILVSPAIDHSEWGVAGISVSWRQGLREFNSDYFVGYRVYMGGMWTDWRNYQVNTDDIYPTNSAHFSNETGRVFMGGAQMGDSLQIRFVYNANYYYWGVDDIRLIEAPCVDMKAQTNWYAIAPAVNTPVSQVRPWYPLADIYNGGACANTNVNLNLRVWNSGGTDVYNQSLAYGDIAADSLAENQNFATPVDISGIKTPDTYEGQYTVTSDQSTMEDDFNFSDNTIEFSYSTTADLFALETGQTRSLAPAASNYDPGAPHGYVYGNYFYFTDEAELVSVVWGVTNPADVAGLPIELVLYKWVDANANEIAEASEREFVAFATVIFDGSEPDNIILDTPLENFNKPGAAILLDPGAAYLMVMQYRAVDETDFFVLASEDYDYGAVELSSRQAGLPPAYHDVLGISMDGNIDGIDLTLVNNWGVFNIVPVMRLVIEPKVGVKDELPEGNLVKVYPSPASENVNLDLEFTQRMDQVKVTMIDASGKQVLAQNYSGIDRATFEYSVAKLVPGSYTVQVSTEDGTRAVPFVVQR
jgi:hypothetical protein